MDRPLPWQFGISVLKSMIDPKMDDITESIENLERGYHENMRELERLETIRETKDFNPTTANNLKDAINLEQEQEELDTLIQDIKYTMNIQNDEMYKLEKQLKDSKQLDIFQCNAIKRLILSDQRLGLDPEVKALITPCRENQVSLYINAVYNLPWELYHPEKPEEEDGGFEHSIWSKIKSYPSNIFTDYGKSMLKKTLEQLGLMHENIMHNDRTDGEFDKRYKNVGSNALYDLKHDPNLRLFVGHQYGPMVRFELLANYYRWSDLKASVALKHLKGKGVYDFAYPPKRYPSLAAGKDGRRELEQTLELFEDNIRSRKMVKNMPDFGERYGMIGPPKEYNDEEFLYESI